jgi:hypothetical protein
MQLAMGWLEGETKWSRGAASRRWVTGSETGALPVKGEHIQVQWTGDGEDKGKWFGAVVLMHDVRLSVARAEQRPKCQTTFRRHFIQYTGDDQEEDDPEHVPEVEWVLLEWSERPSFTKKAQPKKNPSMSRWTARRQREAIQAALDLLNPVPWKRAEAKQR